MEIIFENKMFDKSKNKQNNENMKNKLVFTFGNIVATDSLIIAEELKIPHKRILRSIERILEHKKEFLQSKTKNGLRLQDSSIYCKATYKTEDNRDEKRYILNKPALSLFFMNVNYKNAFLYKVQFNEAFYLMEKALQQQQNASWIEARDQGKVARHELTDTIQKFVEYATAQGSQHAQHYYANITKMTYKALELIDKNRTTPIRDLIDSMGLGFLMVAEEKARYAIQKGMENELHYKEIYIFAKQEIEKLAAVLPPRCHLKPEEEQQLQLLSNPKTQ